MDRPDYVKCVSLDVGEEHPNYGESWCGRKRVYHFERMPLSRALEQPEPSGEIYEGETSIEVLRSRPHEWLFTSAGHALLHARGQGRLLICQECSKAMQKALQDGTWGGALDPDEEQKEIA
jgi:hypothetical protein